MKGCPGATLQDSSDDTGDDDAGTRTLTAVKSEIPTPRGLNAVQWAVDGRSIFFLLEQEESSSTEGDGGGNSAAGANGEEKTTKAAAVVLSEDAIEYEKHPAFVRLMRVDVASL